MCLASNQAARQRLTAAHGNQQLFCRHGFIRFVQRFFAGPLGVLIHGCRVLFAILAI
jgi:hypothetical protein